MRKLVLVNFKAKTGDYEFEDYRLVVANHKESETETDLLFKAEKAFEMDFRNYFPDSKLLSFVALPTMGAEPEQAPDDRKVFYSESHLIEFGNYLLQRAKNDVEQTAGDVKLDSTVFKVNAVDIINWKESIKE